MGIGTENSDNRDSLKHYMVCSKLWSFCHKNLRAGQFRSSRDNHYSAHIRRNNRWIYPANIRPVTTRLGFLLDGSDAELMDVILKVSVVSVFSDVRHAGTSAAPRTLRASLRVWHARLLAEAKINADNPFSNHFISLERRTVG